MQVNDQVILGIDPGSNIMGYGLIHVKDKHPSLIKMDVLKLNKNDSQLLRMKHIFHFTLQLIEEYLPDIMAIEAPFFGKNVQSMLKLGRAQGTAIAAALYKDIPVFEYSPKKIKQSITGRGSASKEQLSGMLYRILDIKEEHPSYLDATDALGVALCHYYQSNAIVTSGKYNNWESFISKNTDRIIK
ncbi:MAG TPA: crossover junction endodeoxyribonuclease RuvC [Bacteroidales bacterium]|mgnify:CR=1 FL=1|nr:crossover junction endodeoxyribonuclease RuvC [Bacteroidales bacterium]HOR81880.1 crossover junction endodeoxyribonuclease RuvC [Bacteroidales bacterium]HPJ91677.1 crossover junction endodeoxyribonuclease RuvC [Bacteroidales bacterium]